MNVSLARILSCLRPGRRVARLGGAWLLAGLFAVVAQAQTGIAPVIGVQPQSVTVSAGVGASFSVVASGQSPVTYQWFFNNVPISGATSANFTVTSAQARDAGIYSVVVVNTAGAVTSLPATLTVTAPPVILAQPQASVIDAGGTAHIFVTAVGSGPLTFQWLRDGVAVVGEISPLLTVGVPGVYTVVVTNGFGSTTSVPVRIDLPNRLVNLSTLGGIGSGNTTLVTGFVLGGSATAAKSLLIRGVGPALTAFGVGGAATQTVITVNNSRGAVVATNQGWFNNSNLVQLTATTSAVGAFPLAAASGDSALLVNLTPGAYTVSATSPTNAGGNALIEVYEAESDNVRLINLSTRGVVAASGNLTAGVVVQGTTSAKLLVRGVGPALTQFGVTGALTRTSLTFLRNSTSLASNTGWSTSANAADLAAAASIAGAFPLAANSGDSALIVTLAPGAYTAQLTGPNGATGVALIEVYQVP